MNLVYVLIMTIGGIPAPTGQYALKFECQEHLVQLVMDDHRQWTISKTPGGNAYAKYQYPNNAELSLHCMPVAPRMTELP